ncbi:MAG: tyrosine-type recombinase/integrase [Candidatus Dormibacteraeota bacterium]|nr:tyrosine-type recombinase/integrase [Candidatus Dormibacteraeota bacterium]
MRVLDGSKRHARTQLRDGYDVFRLERMGNNVSPRTLEYYDLRIGEFLDWIEREWPAVERFEDLQVDHLRAFRAYMAARTRQDGKPLQPATLHASHRSTHTFLAWAENEGYTVDGRMLRLRPPKRPRKEPTLFHITQLRAILAACERPSEALAVRLLVGGGLRISEVAGLAVMAPDGLGDLMLDSLERGRAELRVRWDAGAKGRKSRRVPITPQLALAVKRYIARDRPRAVGDTLLINAYGRPYHKWGIDSMMDRLEKRVGFHVHAHAFRHTFATVATQLGWNLEKVRAAMGHADYSVLLRYVYMSSERDLGPMDGWAEYVVRP